MHLSRRKNTSSFTSGIAVGLTLAGVALLTLEAARRTLSRRSSTEPVSFIDGVRPPNGVELNVRPAEEANTTDPPRLESEADDFSPISQRW